MFRKLAGIAAGLTLTTTLAVAAPAPASAHTYAEANAVCSWIEVYIWGAPNNITQLSNKPVHLWGSHQADCRYLGSAGWRTCILYDFITGYMAFLGDCWV